jgi:cell wall-associated NlpC family hydrolase
MLASHLMFTRSKIFKHHGKKQFQRKQNHPTSEKLSSTRSKTTSAHHIKKKEMDCSYFTMVVFKNAIGLNLPRTTSEQFKLGRLITNPDSLEIGDLLFFNTTGEIASHVGIYIGDGFFAHASVSEGVTISSINDPYYRKRFNGAKRIIESK